MMIQVILFGEAIGAGAGIRPLTLAANEITGNGRRAFVAGNAIAFHVGNNFTGVHTLFQQFSFIL